MLWYPKMECLLCAAPSNGFKKRTGLANEHFRKASDVGAARVAKAERDAFRSRSAVTSMKMK